MDYSTNFQDNIPSYAFNNTSKNVLQWIQENRGKFDWAKDPNCYEMTNLFLFGAKYNNEGKDVDVDTLTQMWDIRSKDFEECSISSNNFVYRICEDAYQSILNNKPLVNDENSHHALRKMAGLGLYLKQQQRDSNQVSFNNSQELLQLLECSSSLKRFHPELFDKYCFKENIDVLCKLQLEHELPNEITETIKASQNKLTSEKNFSTPDISQGNNSAER